MKAQLPNGTYVTVEQTPPVKDPPQSEIDVLNQQVDVLNELVNVLGDATALANKIDGKVDKATYAAEIAGKVDKTTYAANFTGVFETRGHQKLPSGLIIQWGRVSVGADISNVTFPLAFPSSCFILVSDRLGLADNTADLGVLSYSSTGFSCNPNGGGTWSYLAIGI